MGHGYRHAHRLGFRGPCGCGPWGDFRGRPNREEWLRWLEEYQKDLEQEVADVAELIRRLREDRPAEPTEATTV